MKKKKRIMFLFIVTLLLLLLVKCSKNFNTSNPISQEINKTINDSKKSIEETEPTGKGSKDEEVEKAAESSKNNTSSENKSNSSSTNNKNNSSSNKGSSNKPSSGSSNKNNGNNSSSNLNSNKGGSSSSSSNTGSSSKPDSGSSKPNNGNSSNNKPSHTHTWVNVTKTVNHPAVTHQEDVYENRQVKVKDAWDEKVYVGTTIVCRQCGYTTSDQESMDVHMLETGHSATSKNNYKTVHHDAVYETQRVKVGTKTVVDKAAWTETVVIGQKCSSCGKRK